jgi:integrase
MNLQGFEIYLTRKLPKRSTVQINLSLMRMYFDSFPIFTQENVDALYLIKIQSLCKGSYLNRMRTAFLHYADYCKTPINIDRFKELPSLQTTMSDAEIETFVSLPPPAGNSSKEKWSRWSMFWKIMAFSAIRPGNVASMTVDQVDFGQKCFVLPDTKTDPARIPMNNVIIPELEAYVKSVHGKYLFPLQSKKAPDKVYVEKPDWSNNFKVRTKMMSLKRIGLRPYSLRHSLCQRLSDLDVNPFRVQGIMNHKNITTTMNYYHKSMKQASLAINKDSLGKTNMPIERIRQLKEYIQSMELPEDQFLLVLENERIEIKIK